MQSIKENIGITALYCRLSRDDGTDSESNSMALIRNDYSLKKRKNCAWQTPSFLLMTVIREQISPVLGSNQC